MAGSGDVGIFDRIDVDGGAVGVVGPFGAAGDGTAVEGGGVVGFDRGKVAGTIVADQSHPMDRIFAAVKLSENIGDLSGDIGMDDHLTDVIPSVKAPIGHPEIAKIGERDGAAPAPGVAAEHAGFYFRIYR